jgi:hypothetical protein
MVMRKIEFFGFLVILMLAIFLVFYTSNPSGTKSNDMNTNLDNPLTQVDIQIGKLESLFSVFFIPTQSYTENSTASLDSIGKLSNGYWYINATAFAQHYTKYMAMSVTWYDSSGKIISGRKLVWNQSNLEAQQSYPIHIVSHMNNNEIPSKVKISYFDDPQKTGDDTKAFLAEELNNGSNAWLE